MTNADRVTIVLSTGLVALIVVAGCLAVIKIKSVPVPEDPAKQKESSINISGDSEESIKLKMALAVSEEKIRSLEAIKVVKKELEADLKSAEIRVQQAESRSKDALDSAAKVVKEFKDDEPDDAVATANKKQDADDAALDLKDLNRQVASLTKQLDTCKRGYDQYKALYEKLWKEYQEVKSQLGAAQTLNRNNSKKSGGKSDAFGRGSL